jgi:hypothetical protein
MMSDTKPTTPAPELKIVTASGERDPSSVFDDLSALRRESKLTVRRKSVLVNVDVGRPPNDCYFRCHSDLVLDEATVIRDVEGTSKTVYFVCPAMRGHPRLALHLRPVTLALTYCWPGGGIRIWPVPILGERDFKVWRSARAAFELSRDQWVQMAWSEELSDYAIEVAEGLKLDPAWPPEGFDVLLKRAFDGKIIDSENHPHVRRLRGLLD